MRRILIFSLAYYPDLIGGAEVSVKEITDRIDDIAFDMVTIRSGESKFDRIGNVDIYRIGLGRKATLLSKYSYIFLAFFKAINLHRKNHYDATWSIMANYAGFSALFFKLFHKEIPFILTLQEGDPFDHIKKRVGPMYPLFKMIFRKADKITAISSYLGNWAKVMETKCPITIIPNAVDADYFSHNVNEEEKNKVRSNLGFSQNDTVLITTSRLVVKNAVSDIVESLIHLPKEVKLLILGKGVLEDKLRDQVEVLKLKDRVVFKGFVPHFELPIYLKSSDIFVRPSLSEGLGNSFLEAMASEIPVIATPVGGIVDFLKDGETGLFCEVNNPRSIAQKVLKLIKDRDSRNYIVKNAKKMIEERYEWKKIASDMKNILG